MSTKTHSFRLRLTTLTPVAIGDGRTISPLSDYILDKASQQIYPIHHQKFERALQKRTAQDGSMRVMNEYISKVNQTQGVNKNNFLKEFIGSSLGISDFAALCHPQRFATHGIDNATEATTCLKNARQPYISGSTLKGAIKGALLYDWLMNDFMGKKQLKEIAKLAKRFADKMIPLNDELEDLAEQMEVYLPQNEYRRVNQQKRTIEQKCKRFKQEFGRETDKVLNIFLEKITTRKRMDFSLLQIGDTQLFSESDLAYYALERLFLNDGKLVSIGDIKEAIPAGKTTAFRLNLIPELQNSSLQFLNRADIGLIFKKLNSFSIANARYDKECLLVANDHIKNETLYNALLDFYEQIINDYAQSQQAAALRIGAGKSYFHNSIGLALWQADDKHKVFEDFRYIFYNELNYDNELFPKTRTLVSQPYCPLGWVRLAKDE
ncbi:type III-A CRISPR-associated RAMP protein Csm5 [uncultured Microscilla sp.]|uniref:type III-A CRISPR-associated RAMP protein Csm5 n=1 Tax=uncultured Microscilla sp. TaxID=432653 RepID=UPI00260F9C5C|nr:type III-A CRISPR-associated RAMP protein Csm5 [uncultured Microscilla sp.]